MSDVVLIIDAMTIHKGAQRDPKKVCYVGSVDHGTGLPEAS